MSFLVIWAEVFVTMLIALLALSVVYNLLDSDFPSKLDSLRDVGGWMEEVLIALLVGACAAGVLWVSEHLLGHIHIRIVVVGVIIMGLGYLITHVPEAEKIEGAVFGITCLVVLMSLWYVMFSIRNQQLGWYSW